MIDGKRAVAVLFEGKNRLYKIYKINAEQNFFICFYRDKKIILYNTKRTIYYELFLLFIERKNNTL